MRRFNLTFSMLLSISISLVACRDDAEEKEQLPENDLETEVDNTEAEVSGFDRYDANKDHLWDEKEFGESFDSHDDFSEWDSDRDGALNHTEFSQTTFTHVDTDKDERISREEWNKGRENISGDFASEEDFDLFDTDEDGFLSSEEWHDGFDDTDWFNAFDGNDDEFVSNEEWDRGLFGSWDEDEDGRWTEEEYDSYRAYSNNW